MPKTTYTTTHVVCACHFVLEYYYNHEGTLSLSLDNDTGPHNINLCNNGNVRFVWTSNSSITQTCCWSVRNARIIEVHNSQQAGNNATVLLGDMCISGTSYEYNNTTWLCSESSGTPPATAELRSNLFTLGLPISSVNISSNCSTNNNTPSTDPSGQGPCNMTSDTCMFCGREKRWPKTPAETNVTILGCYKGTVNGE